MWRVVVPLVIALVGVTPEPTPTGGPTVAPTPTRELLYVQAGWVTGLVSGRLYEGTSPTRCADGSIVYMREGDLWRDGERITSTAEVEKNPSCVVGILYEVDGYIWRMSGTSRVRLFEGTDPALHADGRIAYVDRFQGIRGVYVRDGDTVVMPYRTYSTGSPSWGDVLYLSGAGTWGWWDGTMHWSGEYGIYPCRTPDGVYYVWDERWPNIMNEDQWDIYKDGERVIESARQPAW